MKNIPIIKCPVCGQEYLMSEIFVPSVFFGKPGEIIKDDAGRIQLYTGTDPDLTEEYICDNCNTKLFIECVPAFTISTDDFDEEYVTEIDKPKKITLVEDPIF